MHKYHQPLAPDRIYHLFSRAVGNEKLFREQDNYLFFLKKLKQHTAGVCQFYCYSLLPNHFHLLARMEEAESIQQHFEVQKKRTYDSAQDSLSDFIMERFSNCLNSYTKAFNKKYRRRGSLFMDYLRRSVVKECDDFAGFVWYVHKNAVHHQLSQRIGEWPYDSYQSVLSERPTALLRDELLKWFGGRDSFVRFHEQPIYPRPGNW